MSNFSRIGRIQETPRSSVVIWSQVITLLGPEKLLLSKLTGVCPSIFFPFAWLSPERSDGREVMKSVSGHPSYFSLEKEGSNLQSVIVEVLEN